MLRLLIFPDLKQKNFNISLNESNALLYTVWFCEIVSNLCELTKEQLERVRVNTKNITTRLFDLHQRCTAKLPDTYCSTDVDTYVNLKQLD